MKQQIEHVRFAVLEDAGAILDIYGPYVEHTPISFEYEVPSLKSFRERMRNIMKEYPYLVYEKEGKVVGYAYGSSYLSRKAFSWDGEVSIYISREERGRGIGRQLYQPLLAMMKEMGIVNAYALIVHPYEASEQFHKKMGFQEEAVFPNVGYKLGQWQNLIYMKKQLNSYSCPPQQRKNFPEIQIEAEKILKGEGIIYS